LRAGLLPPIAKICATPRAVSGLTSVQEKAADHIWHVGEGIALPAPQVSF
jgi:hypothetical protein